MACPAESAIQPVLVAGIAQYQLVHIHSFLDGNGSAREQVDGWGGPLEQPGDARA